ncbi:unnamed protein product [Parnassius apollo]|uniref:(apollo) hypothetical protein n=1 Tax=Parnassius apollo TaxID=110799 RepID=A0A8S3WVN6_PARAO|nr:unnamed protein product [Parnassius apollo]
MLRSPPASRDRDKVISDNSVAKCTDCEMVINELLAFVANKVDTLAELGLIQICLSAYSYDDIEFARQTVYKLLAPQKRITRRKEGSEKNSLQEIIKLIKEFEPDCLPVFVAKDLNKLPPVTFDSIDVTTFLKDMALLKKEIAALPTSSNPYSSSLESLKKDLADVKLALKELQEKRIGFNPATCDTYSSPISCEDKIPERRVVKNKSGPKSLLAKISSHASTPAAPLPPEPTVRASCSPTTSQGAANNKSVLQSSGTDSKQLSSQPSYAKVADGSDLGPKFALDCDLLTVSEHNDNVNNSHVLSLKPIKEGNWTTATSKRQKRLENRKGKAHPISEFNFKAAERTLSLYISRVHRDSTANDIAGFIKYKTQLETVVTKINTYENSFNAFKITVPLHKADLFLNDEGDQFWPAGIVFRKFRERGYRPVQREPRNENKITNKQYG